MQARIALLILLLLITSLIGKTAQAVEPTVGCNGWTNVPGVLEGTITPRPVDTTVPAPPLGYMEYLPKGYQAGNANEKWPLIVFISGLGEIGDGTNNAGNSYQLYTNMTRHGPFHQMVASNWDFPAVVVAVQNAKQWDDANILVPEFQYLLSKYEIDTTRIYFTGLCDVASGVLTYSCEHPGFFAAIMPIESGTPPNPGEAAVLTSTPMWSLHCFNDPLIARTSSIEWVDQVTQAAVGSSDVMSTYPGYAGVPNHEAAHADPVTNLPLTPAGSITTCPNCSFTNGSSWIAFDSSTTFGSALFNTWGSTDAWPYARITYGPQPDRNAKAGVMLRDTSRSGSHHGPGCAGTRQLRRDVLADQPRRRCGMERQGGRGDRVGQVPAALQLQRGLYRQL